MFCLLIISNYSQTFMKFLKCTKYIFLGRVWVTNLYFENLEMTNLRTDETAFFRSLTKIGTDKNKGIYSKYIVILSKKSYA